MLGRANLTTTTAAQRPGSNLPGSTASGFASAAQLAEATPCLTLRTDMTAAPGRLILLSPVQLVQQLRAIVPRTPLAAEDYPVLAGIWDNDADGIFDTV